MEGMSYVVAYEKVIGEIKLRRGKIQGGMNFIGRMRRARPR
jgi:hypothetical protein